MPTSSSESTKVLPLLEEELEAGKRLVETGRVRISTRVREHQELLDQTLLAEQVEIARVPIDKAVSEPPAVRQEGDTTVIPVVEEVLVVEKRLVLREEVHVRRRRTAEKVRQPVTLRAEHAVVERDAPGSPIEKSSETQKE